MAQSPDTPFVTPEEWDRHIQLTNRTLTFNFLILPKIPGDHGTFLNRNGDAVVTDYSLVDWKGLSTKLQDRLDGHVPKSVKVYVADDGPDVLDMINQRPVSIGEGFQDVTDSDFATRTNDAIQQVGIAGYRGGILKVSSARGLHLYPPNGNYRPPLSGLVFGIKFTKMLQAMDYLPTTLDRLIGTAFGMPMRPMSMINDLDAPLTLIPEIHEWLEEQFGAVYSTECGLIFLSVTHSK